MLDGGKLLAVWDMPTYQDKGKARVDGARLGAIMREAGAEHAFLERVGAMPGQGVSSMFAFGRALGIVEGVLGALCLPFTWLAPAQWKMALRVPADKGAARARASQLLPAGATHWPLVKHDGRAEAALIGLYGARVMGLAPSSIEW